MTKSICIVATATILAWNSPAADAPNAHASFDEIRELLVEHLTGASSVTINAAAVQGLINELSPRVQLNPAEPESEETPSLLTNTNRFNREFGYLRIAHVEEGLAAASTDAVRSLLTNGPLRGLVLDLRFAQGTSYSAAANLAGLFADEAPAVVRVADQEFLSASGGDAITVPVMVLVNQKTSAAAEATAAALRELKAGLVIGSSTAGLATVYEDFNLASGDTLRLAVEPVRVGRATEIPATGLVPDIKINVSLTEEESYLANPFYMDRSNGRANNGVSSRRVTEADLVRQRREGLSLDEIISDRQSEASDRSPLVTDPALARALDLLTALSVVDQWGGENN